MSDCDAKPGRGGRWDRGPLTADQQALAEQWTGAARGAARRWSRRRPDLAVEFVSAAMFAVCVAARNFDGSRGYKFFTYLQHHLRHARKEVLRVSVPKGFRITGSLRTAEARAARQDRPDLFEVRESDLVGRDRDHLGEAEDFAADHGLLETALARLSPLRRTLVDRTVLGRESLESVARDLGLGSSESREIRRLALRQLGVRLAPGRRLVPLD